ncbi:MAG TPA: hypothetical protein VID30_04630 [Bradyrhizobium sp.]
MNRLCTASVIAALAMFGLIAPAFAVPPTVTPSPGYDARLQESRKAAAGSSSTVVQPAAPFTPPRHHGKRKH